MKRSWRTGAFRAVGPAAPGWRACIATALLIGALLLAPPARGAVYPSGGGQGFKDDFFDFAVSGAQYSLNPATGNLLITSRDVELDTSRQLPLQRAYNSRVGVSGGAGRWLLSSSLAFEQNPQGVPAIYYYNDPTGYVWSFLEYDDGFAGDPVFGTAESDATGRVVVKDDEWDHTRVFSNGRIVEESEPSGGHVTYLYDSNWIHRPTRIVTSSGTYNLVLNAAGNVTKIIAPSGTQSAAYGYGSTGTLDSFTDGVGQTTNYFYNADRQLTSVHAPNGDTLSISYAAGRPAGTVSRVEEHGRFGDRWINLSYGTPAPDLCESGTEYMVTATDFEGAVSRYCVTGSTVTASDGPGQTNWLDFDDDDGSGPDDPAVGGTTDEFDGDPPFEPFGASSIVAAADLPHCKREIKNSNPVSVMRIKFTRKGETRAGDEYYQYHLHWQIRPPYSANTARSWIAASVTRPNGDFDNSLFDDSDTRKGRGDDWKPWYAHFLRVRVKPFADINVWARSTWKTPYPIGGNRLWTGQHFYGGCNAHLR